MDDLPPEASSRGSSRSRSRSTVEPGRLFTPSAHTARGRSAGLLGADYGLIAGDAGSGNILKADSGLVAT